LGRSNGLTGRAIWSSRTGSSPQPDPSLSLSFPLSLSVYPRSPLACTRLAAAAFALAVAGRLCRRRSPPVAAATPPISPFPFPRRRSALPCLLRTPALTLALPRPLPWFRLSPVRPRHTPPWRCRHLLFPFLFTATPSSTCACPAAKS
jgi:hypothetical protein